MRYILTFLVVVCMSAFCAYKTADADSEKFPYDKGGFNVRGAHTWGNYGIFDGKVYFVDNTDANASDDPSSGLKRKPFNTLDYAISRTGVTTGDLFIVLPGSTQTVSSAGGLDLDVAGINILGVGNGNAKPAVWFTSTSTADMDVDAANITMANFIFEARSGGLVAPIDINAPDFKLLDFETRDITSIGSATNFIKTDANADRFFIDRWIHRGTDTTGVAVVQEGFQPNPQSALSLTGGDDIMIRNANIYGNFALSGIIATTTGCTRLTIGGFDQHTQIWTENATDSVIDVGLSSTGWVGPNIACMLQDNAANITEAVSGASMQFIQPIHVVNLAGESSTETNITRSVDE